MQRKLQSMDINKNTERYKFNPGNKTFNFYNETPRLNIRENSFTRTNKFPPIYFYRKVNVPYKYSITSVPEYLIKTNEEKRFMDKLYKSLNEKDKKILNDLLNKTKSKLNKDNLKPQCIDVQKLLKYKPKLYSHVNDEMILKNIDNLNNNKFYIDYKNEKKNKSELNVNTFPNVDAELENKGKNEEENNERSSLINNDKKEITDEEQIKYKYKLSDIFNLRKEKIFTNKSAEKHLFKKIKENNYINTSYNLNSKNEKEEEKKENKFYTSSESKSDWIPGKIKKKKMGTNSSVAYNILCPNYAGSNRFITPTELNKDNLYNESPAFRRVKSISEFIDLTRVSATNTLGCFDRNMKIPNFRFNNNIGTNQLDAYHINKDLIEKPI